MFLLPYRDDTPVYSYPLITHLLIALNVFFFIFPLVTGRLNLLYAEFGFTFISLITKPYTLVTSIFLHAGFLHIISNMWFLWLFGDNIEDKYGHLPFLWLYLMAGFIGNLSHFLFTGITSDVPVIGASGAVAGIMGAYLVRFPGSKVKCVFLLIFYPIFLRIRALWFLGFWMLFEFLNAFHSSSSNIAHWAHVGGFLTGFAWALGRRDKLRKFQRVNLS